jgi:anti-sigma-K factor RskA
MTMLDNNDAPERQEIEALLPWHAAGTLNRRDAQRVERALASDRELVRHYDLVREELNETIHLNEMLGVPSSRAMERLFAAIDAEAPVARRSTFDFAGRIAEWLSAFSPRTLAWSAAAAAVAIVVQGAVLTTVAMKEQNGATHELASASTHPGQTRAVVRFSPSATSTEITKFLQAHKVTLIGGPKKGGLYTLSLANTDLPPDKVTKMVKDMQSEPGIVEFVAVQE